MQDDSDLIDGFRLDLLSVVQAIADRKKISESKLLGSGLDRTYRDWVNGGGIEEKTLNKLIATLGSLIDPSDSNRLRKTFPAYRLARRSFDGRSRDDRMARTMRLPQAKDVVGRLLAYDESLAMIRDPVGFHRLTDGAVDSMRRQGDFGGALRNARAMAVVLEEDSEFLGVTREDMLRAFRARTLESLAYTAFQCGDAGAVDYAYRQLVSLDGEPADAFVRTTRYTVQSYLSQLKSEVVGADDLALVASRNTPRGIYPAVRCNAGCLHGGVVRMKLRQGAPLHHYEDLLGMTLEEQLMQDIADAKDRKLTELYLHNSIVLARAQMNEGRVTAAQGTFLKALYARERADAAGQRFTHAARKLSELQRELALKTS